MVTSKAPYWVCFLVWAPIYPSDIFNENECRHGLGLTLRYLVTKKVLSKWNF